MTKPQSQLALKMGQRLAQVVNGSAGRPENVVEPMDEATLTREIARIMEQRPQTTSAFKEQETHWLGEDEDRAAVDAFNAKLDEGAEAETDAASGAAEDADADLIENSSSANSGTGTAVGWVRQARRHRFRNKLRNAAGWALSLSVSLLLVAVVGFAVYGWPNGKSQVRQVPVKPVKISEQAPAKLGGVPQELPTGVVARQSFVRADAFDKR